MTKMKYKSDAFEAIHSSANALFKVGAIDKANHELSRRNANAEGHATRTGSQRAVLGLLIHQSALRGVFFPGQEAFAGLRAKLLR